MHEPQCIRHCIGELYDLEGGSYTVRNDHRLVWIRLDECIEGVWCGVFLCSCSHPAMNSIVLDRVTVGVSSVIEFALVSTRRVPLQRI